MNFGLEVLNKVQDHVIFNLNKMSLSCNMVWGTMSTEVMSMSRV